MEEDTDDAEDQRLGIQSVEIAAHILNALAPAGHPIPLKELARRAGFSTGKVHRYLVSLTRVGLVDQDPDTGHYGVGRGAVAIGLAGLWAASANREAARAIARLRDTTGETAFAAIWTDAGPVVSLLEECERPIYMNIRVGALLPLQASAAGRVYSAHLPATVTAKAERLQRDALPATPTLPAEEFAAVLQHVRTNGYASVSGLIVGGINAIAAPVMDYRGKVAVAIGLLGRDGDLSVAEGSKHVVALLEAARATSERLGFAAPSPKD